MADVTPRAPPPADPEDFVLRSGVRSGLKREFAFALKAQAEMLVTPVGRTRSGKIPRSSPFSRQTASEKPRKSESTGSSPSKNNGQHEETPSLLPPTAEGVKGEMQSEIIVLDGEKMPAATSITEVSEIQMNGEYVAGTLIPIQADSGSVTVMTPIFQTEARAMEMTDLPVQTEDRSSVHNRAEINTQLPQKAAVPERYARRFTRSLLKSSAEENGVPEESVSLLKSSAEENGVSEESVSLLKSSAEENGVPEESVSLLKSSAEENGVPEESVSLLKSSVEENVVPEESISISKSSAEENGVPEQSVSLLKISAEESVVPEKPTRRFTRSLLKAAVEEPPLPMVEQSSVLTADVSSAASGGSDGFEEAKDAADTANGPNEQLRTTPKKKMELKMSKKIALTKVPSNIKDLLATGLLEGLTVKYVARSYDKQRCLHGVIQGGNILCFCASCKGLNAVSAYNFELHAGSTNKHPSDYIYLENGSTFRDVIRACTSAPLDMLEATIQKAISPVGAKSLTCGKCKESSDKSHIGRLASVCESCLIAKLSPTSPKPSQEIMSNARHSGPTLAPKSSDSASKSLSSQKKSSQGRMTRKDLRLHKLVFMDGILPDGTEVAYYTRGQRLLEGYIKGYGIFCRCCNSMVSPSQFEAHAGWASRRKPYLNIYTSNGVSLHELSVSLSKGRKFSASENDDLCRVCADGGDLLLCDLCPRAFHKECVGLTSIPKGDWYCPCCQNMHQKEKFVEHNENAIAAGRVAGVDPIEQIFERCIRIVKTPESDGGCVLCRCHDFSKNGFGPRTVLLCDQCEREFHVGCLNDHNMADLKELPEGMWFCSSDCSRIHAGLQKLLTSGAEQLSDHQSDAIRRKYEQKGLSKDIDLDVRWRLLSGKAASPDARLLLAKAVSILHECFDPIYDFATGKDLIPAMVYGKNLRDQEFERMCCAVLTVNSSVVSAGILRVFGCEVAELPLVATSRESQGLGYFQALFSCVERMLESLNVKRLVLPAADEAESIWIKKFGFSKISMDQLREYAKGSHSMVFEGTSTLHKLILKSPTECAAS